MYVYCNLPLCITHIFHVHTIGASPLVSEVFFHFFLQSFWDLVELYKLFDKSQPSVVMRATGIQALNNGRQVSKDGGIHEG